jgi:hypothetical protein
MPPQETIETFPRREPFEAIGGHKLMRVPLTVKAGTAIRRGAVCGVKTADGYVRERKHTLAAGTGFADDSPTGQVTNGDGVRFEVGDTLKNEAGETIGEIQAIDVTTNPDTITLTGNAQVNVAAGEAVVADDGSEVAACIAEEEVKSTEAKDTVLSVDIGGAIKESLVIGLDDSARAELNGKSFPGGIFKF